jgi:hypothetical protein
MGIDIQSGFGGTTRYLDINGNIQSAGLPNSYAPRFLIGGTHFWGHADFCIGIPLFITTHKQNNQEIKAQRGVETTFKYFPLRIERNKVRPYLGVSLADFYFEQQNNNLPFSSGPELNQTGFPLIAGLTFNSKNQLFDLGFSWNYQNQQNYYISRTHPEKINTPPFYANLTFRIMLETTMSAEKDWESGRTKQITDILAEKGRLNSLYFGVGISSNFWLKKSSYNETFRPYINKYINSTMADFALGYYLHNPDLNLALAYRGYKGNTNTYGAVQEASRKSLLMEITKHLFDYHGFVPFAGPAISYENLSFKEDFEGSAVYDIGDEKIGYGLTFGWDIRPNRIQSWILRTNLRWFPDLFLEVEGKSKISFDNLEFNFIQLIIYPNRMIKRKPKPENSTFHNP